MMKNFMSPALVAALLVPLCGSAQEVSVTANAGWTSEYLYRGIPQESSSASAGLDVALAGLYVGAWGADVGAGNEVDVYTGYGFEIDDFSVSVGGTGYFYTGDFDHTYLEANVRTGVGPISAEFSIGQYDSTPVSQNYWFLGFTAEHRGLYATVGSFGDEFDGEYVEAGYGFTANELDLSIGWIFSSADLVGSRDQTLVFGVSKSFEIN